MSKHKVTRRGFLESSVLGMSVFAMSLCVSMSTGASQSQTFTFVQMCDTQLGMGGYEHDVKAFKQAVAQINALEPEFVVICGDLVHNANEKSFADFKKIKTGLNVPCHCVSRPTRHRRPSVQRRPHVPRPLSAA